MLKENKSTLLVLVAIIIIAIGLSFRPIQVNLPDTTQETQRPLGQILDTFTGDYFVALYGLTSNGTTTADNNLDGGFAEDFITVSATGSAQMVYTNTGGPKFCSATGGGVYVYNVATAASPLAPSLVFALGTSTSATGYSTNLMASTTVATTTNMLLTTLSRQFILGPTESIVGSISDGIGNNASSTYFSNWRANFKISCTLLEA